MTVQIRETLIAARALIMDPEHWTQGSLAIENTGVVCRPDDIDAYAFCAIGAIAKVCGVRDVFGDAVAENAIIALENAAANLFTKPSRNTQI